MINPKGTPAIFNLPMQPGDFQLAQEAQIQNVLLTDPEMIREEIKNRNSMVRENHKSALRQAEAARKQQMKTTNTEVYQTDYGGQPTDCQWSGANPPEGANLFLQDCQRAALLPCHD